MTEQDEINSSANKLDLPFATSEKQEARAFLRERFLRVITGIIGKKVCVSHFNHAKKKLNRFPPIK